MATVAVDGIAPGEDTGVRLAALTVETTVKSTYFTVIAEGKDR